MSNTVLDYAFKVSEATVIPEVDTAWIKVPAVVVKPAEGVEAGIYRITNKEEIADYTDNEHIGSILNVKSYCYLIASNTLNIADVLDANLTNLYTVIISDDFDISDFGENRADLKLGSFKGVVAYANKGETAEEKEFLENFAKFGCAFAGTTYNMCHAFSMLLGGTAWQNQQYIDMPNAGYDNLGDAEYNYEKRISFVLNDEAKYYLAFFAVAGRAIIAPYVIKEITLKQQSKAFSWIAANQPTKTIVNAKLLQDRLNLIYTPYLEERLISAGSTTVNLDNDAFSCSGKITITDPTALWRVEAVLKVES